ncbi:MAG: SDR family NAD(P)-dependent oxidoreductase [Candidatus Velthaea sp.]
MPSTHRVALITGASSGIGAAIARDLGARGYHLALAARRKRDLESVALAIRTAGGGAIPLVCDVTKPDQIATCVARTLTEFGRIDVLVNNAGVMHNGLIAGADVAEWRAMIDVNLMGLMLVTHAVLPHMKAAGGGHIVNISSVAGRIVTVNNGVYNVTKWGVNVFSEALRKEVYTDNIKITVIGPGVVETDLKEKIANPQARATFKAFAAGLDPLTVEDVAGAVAYALEAPPHVAINEVLMRPLKQER